MSRNLLPKRNGNLHPLLKWPGGKERELCHIMPASPPSFSRFFEPFVGGGAVFFAFQGVPSFINDKCEDLIRFYTCVREGNDSFYDRLELLAAGWETMQSFATDNTGWILEIYPRYKDGSLPEEACEECVDQFLRGSRKQLRRSLKSVFPGGASSFDKELHRNLWGKIQRMRKVEAQRHEMPPEDIVSNFETALKSGFYMEIRRIYNEMRRAPVDLGHFCAVFFFLREYAYASMFRFNRQGDFNVPYGGMGYNRKDIRKKIRHLMSDAVRERLLETTIECLDFIDFFQAHPPSADDFVFIDPPYDSDFKDYDGMSFGPDDQRRLARFLLEDCPAKFMVVIKNTDLIHSLYKTKSTTIRSFDKKYMWTIKERNDRDAEHLLITNY